MTEAVTAEAHRLVNGDRNESYGHPLDDWTRAGRMIGAILEIPDVPAEKVGLIMQAIKVAREVHQPKRDNRVDGCGYWEGIDMVHAERSRRAADPHP